MILEVPGSKKALITKMPNTYYLNCKRQFIINKHMSNNKIVAENRHTILLEEETEDKEIENGNEAADEDLETDEKDN
jgi:hypothetical protein